jgi:hypothetical protein
MRIEEVVGVEQGAAMDVVGVIWGVASCCSGLEGLLGA